MRRGLALLLALAAAACTKNVAGGSTDGAVIFAEACAACHGPRGVPSQVMAASLGVRDLTSREFTVRATPALVSAQVRNGSANRKMPAFAGALTEVQITAVADYVMTLSAGAAASR